MSKLQLAVIFCLIGSSFPAFAGGIPSQVRQEDIKGLGSAKKVFSKGPFTKRLNEILKLQKAFVEAQEALSGAIGKLKIEGLSIDKNDVLSKGPFTKRLQEITKFQAEFDMAQKALYRAIGKLKEENL